MSEGKVRYRLASVVLDAGDFLADTPGVLYRAEEGSSAVYDAADNALTCTGLVDLCTYFNGVSVGKWRKYADVREIFLHLEVAGDACGIAARSLAPADGMQGGVACASDVTDVVEVPASGVFQPVELAMSPDAVVAGFAVLTEGAVRIRNAYYYAEVDAGRIRPVKIALCTTTFKKEDFIVPNIARIRAGVIQSDGPIAGNFHMFVVDNGRTLDVQELAGDGVTVIPNPNVGGSGGFARGMIAALDSPQGFTHVILMDDDVRMFPESFNRTFALLSLVTDEYADACLNGAMLELERPALQFEDVSYARRTGGYEKVKDNMHVDDPLDVMRNELVDVEVPHAYGAWWYSCIPMGLIRQHGLPMPFFVRCDDVEYGVRLQTRFMCMNGICVWHARFDARFNAAVVCYQYARNMLITIALHEFFDERVFMVRFWRSLRIFLRSLDYAAAELWLDGLDDYLRGPDRLVQIDGAKLIAANSARSEKLVPLDQLDPEVMGKLEFDVAWLSRPDGYHDDTLQKTLVSIPHDRHMFPDFMLSDSPGPIAPGQSYTPWPKTAMRKQLVALSIDGKSGAVRTIDRDRYESIVARYRQLMKRYRDQGAQVAAEWRAAMPRLTSHDFWLDYLAEKG